MPNWIDEQVQRQRFNDMVRTARHDQLASVAQATRSQRPHFYHPILVEVGRWLELWGYRLQTRYGAEVAIVTDRHAAKQM
jgi:1,4-alpha-glucan branching enzyme